MAVRRVNLGEPITAAGQNALIDQSNANADLGVDGMFWGSGSGGHTGGIQPTAGIAERFFELADPHAPGGTTPAYPIAWDSSGSEYITDTEADTFDVVDVFSRFRGRGRDDEAATEFDSGGTRGKHGSKGRVVQRNGQWEIEWMQPHALRVRANVNGPGDSCSPAGFTAGDSTVCIDSVEIIQPIAPALLMADVEISNNIYLWIGDNDAIISVEWNDITESWDVYQMDCAAEE